MAGCFVVAGLTHRQFSQTWSPLQSVSELQPFPAVGSSFEHPVIAMAPVRATIPNRPVMHLRAFLLIFDMRHSLAVVVYGQHSSLDVFGSPQNFARAYKKVMRGAFSEAMTGTEATPNAIAVVQAALWQLASARATRIDAPGRGQSVHAASGTYAVGAIIDEGRVVHAFVAG